MLYKLYDPLHQLPGFAHLMAIDNKGSILRSASVIRTLLDDLDITIESIKYESINIVNRAKRLTGSIYDFEG